MRDYDGERIRGRRGRRVLRGGAGRVPAPLDAVPDRVHPRGAEPDYRRDACPFCVAPTLSDEEALIVARGTHAYVLLNLFPYNSGHLLVCPYRHVALYDEATDEEVAEIGSLTQTAMRVLTATSGAHGYNIGMNQGRLAGAGVADHLHQHVVPRWALDSNFFPIIAGPRRSRGCSARSATRSRRPGPRSRTTRTTGIRLAGDRGLRGERRIDRP